MFVWNGDEVQKMNILVDVDDKPSFGIASRDVSEVLSNCKTKFKCHVLIVIPCILDLCLAPTFVFLSQA